MKNKLSCIFLLSFTLSLACVASAAQNATNDEQYRKGATFQIVKYEHMMEKAAEDVASNTDFWVALQKETDGAATLVWRIILASKLPSQPIAVLEVFFRTKSDLTFVCSSPFMEGAEYSAVNKWIDDATNTLQSFTLVDQEADKIRQECLRIIKSRPKLKAGE